MSASNTPKVSIAVATYNHGQWLAQCLESIVTQTTDFPFEVLVGDDASTDKITVKIVQEYAARYPNIIKPVLREKNIGPTANVIDLLQRAQGKYIAHIDGDDFIAPKKLQTQCKFLDENPDTALVAHRMTTINANGDIIGKFPQKKPTPKKFDANYLLANHALFAHSSIMYRCEAIKKINVGDQSILDLHVYLIIGTLGNYAVLEQSLGFYRKNVGLASTNYVDKPQLLIIDLAKELQLAPRAIKKYCARREHAHAYRALKNKNYKDSFICSLKSLKHYCFSLMQLSFLIYSGLLCIKNGLRK